MARGRTKDFPWEKSRTCVCGKPAEYKGMVALYKLNKKPRHTRSCDVIPLCETCIVSLTKDIAGVLAIGLTVAHKRLAEAA